MTPAFLEFGDSHMLGIAVIDMEHQQLAELLNRLATVGEPEGELVVALLTELHGYTRAHFAHEETMMEAFGFVELASHRREHSMLLAELKGLLKAIENGSERLDALTLQALKGWLLAHIVGSDKAFAAEFLRHG